MFVQVAENKSFRPAGVNVAIQPIVTLKNENNDYAFIVKDDNNNYILFRGEKRRTITPTHKWFPEAVAALQMLPTPDRLPIDEAGNPIPPELGELPENWDINRDTAGIFILVQYQHTGQEIGSRNLTGKRLKVKVIVGVTNAFTVLESEGFPQLIGQRITHDPIRDKVFVG